MAYVFLEKIRFGKMELFGLCRSSSVLFLSGTFRFFLQSSQNTFLIFFLNNNINYYVVLLYMVIII